MKKIISKLMGGVLLFSLSMSLTSCEGALDDILGEWSRPTPGSSTGGAVAVTSIDLDADEMKLAVGDQGQLNITDVAPADATDKTVSWSSNQEAIATVDKNGLVTAVAAGTAVITATANDGSGVKATCTVTVKIPGLLAGKFSVSATEKVQFSQGNLQAKIASYASNAATASEWKFADSQYSYIGNAAGNNSFAVDTWVDLFSWVGNSADNDTYGLITFTSSTQANHGNVASESLKTDWGKLAISNGGNTANSGWRTLTGGDSGEWKYLLDSRTTATTNMPTGTNSSEARYTKATVAGVSGVILFPDNYAHPAGVTVTVSEAAYNTANKAYNTFTVDAPNWSTMEEAGCVFLPAAGLRNGTTVTNAGLSGYYCSSSPNSSDAGRAFNVYFESDNLSTGNGHRYLAFSVRLVRDVAE